MDPAIPLHPSVQQDLLALAALWCLVHPSDLRAPATPLRPSALPDLTGLAILYPLSVQPTPVAQRPLVYLPDLLVPAILLRPSVLPHLVAQSRLELPLEKW